MTNYLPRNQKKLDRVRELEAELVRQVGRGADREQLEKIAILVRDAHVRVYRAHLAQLPPNGLHDEKVNQFKGRIAEWSSKSPAAILAQYVDSDQA